MRKRTTLTFAAVAFVLVASAALPGTAQAADWSVVGSWWNSADLKGAGGLGVRASFPFNENWEADFSVSYFENFRDAVAGSGKVEVGVIPADFGITWNRKGEEGGFNAAAGLTYGFMDIGGLEVAGVDIPQDGATADDEFGFYGKLGWRNTNGFMLEAFYRFLPVSIENINPASGYPGNRLDLDMDGFVVNIGYRF